MNKKRIGLIAAVALVGLGTLTLVRYVTSAEARALSGEELVDVLVVDQPVPAGTPASELAELLRVEAVPTKVQAAGALASLESAQNQVVSTDLVPGEQLTASRLVAPEDLPQSGGRVATGGKVTVPDGLLEVSIPLDPIRSVGGTIRPGDLVGVIVSFDAITSGDGGDGGDDDPEGEEEVSGFLLHKALVTNVQGVAVPEPTGEALADDRPEIPTGELLVTVAVDGPSAEKLVFASQYGNIWLALEPASAPEVDTSVLSEGRIFD